MNREDREMTKRFEGKTAVIVGGAGGIGWAITQGLISEGAKVTVGDMDQTLLDSMVEEFGSDLVCVRTDATKQDEQKALVDTAVRKFGKLDIAFNVAGGSKMGLIDEGSVDDWDWTVDLCLKGTYLGMRYQLRAMKENGGGSIVNISSINAVNPAWADSAYNAAKNGVISLTQTAVIENAKYGIRCNAVLPGLTDTKMTQSWWKVPEIREAYMNKIPMKRKGQPEEVGKAALFLASDDASYINAASLLVDGGRAAAGYPNFIEALEKDRTLWEV